METFRLYHRAGRPLVAVVCGGLLAGTGCTGNRLASFYEPADACSAERQPLVDADDSFKTWTGVGIGAGAVLGAALGAMLGGDAKSTALGGVAGAALGGAGGYLAAKQRDASDRAALMASISQDAASDTQRVRDLRRAVAALGACRERQAATVVADFNAGTLDRPTALANLSAISAAAGRDGELTAQVTGNVAKRVETYEAAQLQLEPVPVAVAPTEVQTQAPPPVETAPVVPIVVSTEAPPPDQAPRVVPTVAPSRPQEIAPAAPPETVVAELAVENAALGEEQRAIERRLAAYREEIALAG